MYMLKVKRGKSLTAGLAVAFFAIGCGDDDGSPVPTDVEAGVEAGAPTTDTETTDSETTDGETSQPNTTDTTDDTPTTDDTTDSDGETTDSDSDGGLPGDSDDGGGSWDLDDSGVDGGPALDDGGTTSDDGGIGNEGDGSADAGPVVGWVGLEVGEALPIVAPVEADGDDSYLGVVFDADGNFYTVGPATDVSGEVPDSYMAVTKFLANGTKDTDFGSGGVAKMNVAVGGVDSPNAIVIQTTGEPATDYIVIAGTAQFASDAEGLAAAEQDVALVRFTMDGVVDATFGEDGVVRIDLNSGIEGVDRAGAPAWVSNDSVWSISTTMGDKLVVHGSQRAEGVVELGDGGVTPREDADWALLRLDADGSLDTSFGEGGKVTLDLEGAGASARSATVLADGSIVGSGYLTSDVLGESTQQPVLYKVTPDGEFDTTFAVDDAWVQPGVFHDMVVTPPLRAEAYGAALQGDNFVTMGYGPTITAGGTGSDFIALRFTNDGAFDTSFGTNGVTYVDGTGQSDNGRSLVILPDMTILGIGGGRTLLADETTPSDGMLALLTPDGHPIDAFGVNGRRLYDMNGSSDFFWAGAVSPDESMVVVVGLKGAGEGEDADTDGAVLILPLSSLE